MPDLKLAKLPDRTPVKITITVAPYVHTALQNYAAYYQQTYGEGETVAELVPYMLESFLNSDRGFAKAVKEGKLSSAAFENASPRTRRSRRRRASEQTTQTTN